MYLLDILTYPIKPKNSLKVKLEFLNFTFIRKSKINIENVYFQNE